MHIYVADNKGPISLRGYAIVVIGGTVGPVSSVGRAPDLQAGGRGFESCIGHTFSSLVYFTMFLVLLYSHISNINGADWFRSSLMHFI